MKLLSLILFSLLFSVCVRSQSLTPEVISTAGNHFSATGISISWTIGEPAIETIGSSTSQLTQGFHQPFLTIDGVEEINDEVIFIYPNPSQGILNFSIPADVRIKSLLIYSIEGKFISSATVSGNRSDISTLAAGAYIIKIETDKSVFTYRLIKN